MKKAVFLLGVLSSFFLFADDLQVAQMSLGDGNYVLAKRFASSILQNEKESLENQVAALEVYLRTFLAKQEYAELLSEFEKYPHLTSRDKSHALATLRMAAFAALGQGADLLKTGHSLDDKFGEWVDLAHEMMAAQFVKDGSYTNAYQYFSKISTSTNYLTRVKNAYAWASVLSSQNSNEVAIKHLKPFEESQKNEDEANCALLLAKIYLTENQSETAISLMQKVGENRNLPVRVRVRAYVDLAANFEHQIEMLPQALKSAEMAFELSDTKDLRRMSGQLFSKLLLKDSKSFSRGVQLLRSIIQEDPSYSEAPILQICLAEALLQNDLPEDALKEYERYAVAYDVPELAARARAGRARALVKLERYSEAITYFNLAVDSASNDLPLQQALLEEEAFTALTAQTYKKAIEIYQILIEKATTDEKKLGFKFALADVYERDLNVNEALKLFREVANSLPENQLSNTAALRLAGLLSNRNRFPETVSICSQLIQRSKFPAIVALAYLERGRALYKDFKLTDAVEDFKQIANEVEPAIQEDARFMLVLSLYELGRDEESRKEAEAYLVAYPKSERIPDVMIWLGKADFTQGKYEQARKTFMQFLERWPKHKETDSVLLWTARASSQLNDYVSAIAYTSQLVSDYPKSKWLPEARFVQSEALIEQARFNEAVVVLNDLIINYPNSEWVGDAYGRKADCLFTMATDVPERYSEAITAYREALLRITDNSDLKILYNYKIGRSYEKQKLFDEAANQYYENVIIKFLIGRAQGEFFGSASRTWMMKALYQLSGIYNRRGEKQQALRILRRVIRAEIPGTEDAVVWLKQLERE